MKLPTLLLTLTAALLHHVHAEAEAEAVPEPTYVGPNSGLTMCKRYFPSHYTAILNFCNGNDTIMVPSTYASAGKSVDGHWVRIEGVCKTPEWVPWNACLWNFYRVCGSTGDGTATMHWGTDGCQAWEVGVTPS